MVTNIEHAHLSHLFGLRYGGNRFGAIHNERPTPFNRGRCPTRCEALKTRELFGGRRVSSLLLIL